MVFSNSNFKSPITLVVGSSLIGLAFIHHMLMKKYKSSPPSDDTILLSPIQPPPPLLLDIKIPSFEQIAKKVYAIYPELCHHHNHEPLNVNYDLMLVLLLDKIQRLEQENDELQCLVEKYT